MTATKIKKHETNNYNYIKNNNSNKDKVKQRIKPNNNQHKHKIVLLYFNKKNYMFWNDVSDVNIPSHFPTHTHSNIKRQLMMAVGGLRKCNGANDIFNF